MKPIKKSHVWLLQWMWMQDDRFSQLKEPPIAAVLDSRVNGRNVMRIMQTIFDTASCRNAGLRAQVFYENSINRRREWQQRGYPDVDVVSSEGGCYRVGSNPTLIGYMASDYCLHRPNCLNEIFYWTRTEWSQRAIDAPFEKIDFHFRVEICYKGDKTLWRRTYGDAAKIPSRPVKIDDEDFLLTESESEVYPG